MRSAMVWGARSRMVSSLRRTEGKLTVPAAYSVTRKGCAPSVLS